MNTLVVYNAYLELEVYDVDSAARQAKQLAYDYGGYLVSSQSWYQDDERYATLTLAIPVARFDTARDALLRLGTLTHESTSGDLINTNDGSDGWNILQERYISAVLFEYAATLGMVDVAYFDPAGARDDYGDMWGTDDLSFLSRYDGLSDFRLTPLGAYVLGLDAAYRPLAIASNVALSVLPSLQVNVLRGTLGAEEALLLENWAVPVQAGSWRLDREKALSAIEKGHDIAELQAFLESRDDLPLPEPVESFIRQCARNGKALKTAGSAVLVECRDNETAEAIAGHKETEALCMRAGPKTLVVRTGDLGKFRERIRVLGFGMSP